MKDNWNTLTATDIARAQDQQLRDKTLWAQMRFAEKFKDLLRKGRTPDSLLSVEKVEKILANTFYKLQ